MVHPEYGPKMAYLRLGMIELRKVLTYKFSKENMPFQFKKILVTS